MWKTIRKIGSIGVVTEPAPAPDDALRQVEGLNAEIRSLLGRALCHLLGDSRAHGRRGRDRAAQLPAGLSPTLRAARTAYRKLRSTARG